MTEFAGSVDATAARGPGSAIKRRLSAGQVVVGATLNFPHAGLAEFVGSLGFDFIAVDAEHAALTDGQVEDVVRAADLAGAAVVLRTPYDRATIERQLAMGVSGVHIPMVRSADEARRVVEAVKYRPYGRRGLGSFRANGYGARRTGVADDLARANADSLVFLAVESPEAVAALPEIVAVDHVDAILIGELDLSDALGVPGDVEDPAVRGLVTEALRVVHDAGRPVGLAAGSTRSGVARAVRRGAQVLLTSVSGVLRTGALEVLGGERETRS